MNDKINIAITGGQCTGKSVTAAALFAHLKISGLDYDLIEEQHRALYKEFGDFQSVYERFYMWRQQEREELRSNAVDGFVTDTCLYHFYASAKMHAKTPRDHMAVRELLRMCEERLDRYQLIVMAKDPEELAYIGDGCRKSTRPNAIRKHQLIQTFVEHNIPDRLLLVEGVLEKRLKQIQNRLKKMGKEFKPLPYR